MIQVQNIFFLLLLFLYVNANSQSMTWQRLYNGQSNSNDNGRGVCETTNGNIYITGYLLSGKAIVLKLKPNGDTIWTKYFDAIRGDFILPTKDGGCVIIGQSTLVYTMKLDSNGNSVWFKTYSGSNQIITTGLINTKDGGYAICGYKTAVLPAPAYVLKIDSTGTLKWQKYFYAGYKKEFLGISEVDGSNYILSGARIECELCNGGPILFKINGYGDSLFEKRFNLFADFKKIYATENGYLVGGTILDSPFVFANSFIMRTNFVGDITFKKNIIYKNREDLKDLSIVNNNKYIIACDTDTLNRRSAGVYIIDSVGNILHRNIFYVTDYSLFFSILPFQNGDIVFSGTVNTHLPQGRDIFAVRTDSTLYAKPLSVKDEFVIIDKGYELFQNYPNPFNPITKIKYEISEFKNVTFQIKIYDLLGKTIAIYKIDKNIEAGEIVFNGNTLSSGIYFYSLMGDNIILQTKKMLCIQ